MALTRTEKMVVNNSAQNDAVSRFLTVCSVGCLRSPTIMKVLYQRYNRLNGNKMVNVRCAGLDPLAVVPVSERLIEWADYVICVERSHADIIANDWEFEGTIYNFSIPDVYDYAHPELEDIISDRLETIDQWVY